VSGTNTGISQLSTNLDMRLKAWKEQYSKYRRGYDGGIWDNIDNHPLDLLFDELAQMCHQYTSVQERNMFSKLFSSGFFKSPSVETWDCVLYTRRLALRLEKRGQIDLLELGIEMISLYWKKHDDIRDSILTVYFLTLHAKRARLDIKSYLEKQWPSADNEVKDLFYGALGKSEKELEQSYRWIDPPR